MGVEVQEGGEVAVTVNHALAERYLEALHEIADKYGLRDDVTVTSLAKMPDVLGSERIEQDADAMIRDVTAVFEKACAGFDEMRLREGEKARGGCQSAVARPSGAWWARWRPAHRSACANIGKSCSRACRRCWRTPASTRRAS